MVPSPKSLQSNPLDHPSLVCLDIYLIPITVVSDLCVKGVCPVRLVHKGDCWYPNIVPRMLVFLRTACILMAILKIFSGSLELMLLAQTWGPLARQYTVLKSSYNVSFNVQCCQHGTLPEHLIDLILKASRIASCSAYCTKSYRIEWNECLTDLCWMLFDLNKALRQGHLVP